MAFNLVKSAWEVGCLIFRNRSSKAGVFTISPQGMREWMSVTDIDTQNGTLTAAAIAGGIIVHTSVTAAGTLTFDTAANILAAFPGIQTGEVIKCYVINDGAWTDTFAVAAGLTIGDVGQTLAIEESCLLLILVTSATTVHVQIIGG